MKKLLYVFLMIGSFTFSCSANAGTIIRNNDFTSTPALSGTTNGDSLQEIVSVYPNPSHDIVSLSIRDGFTTSKKLNVEVYNILGSKVINFDFLSNTPTVIHLANLTNGIYFITVRDNEKVIAVQKIVKE